MSLVVLCIALGLTTFLSFPMLMLRHHYCGRSFRAMGVYILLQSCLIGFFALVGVAPFYVGDITYSFKEWLGGWLTINISVLLCMAFDDSGPAPNRIR